MYSACRSFHFDEPPIARISWVNLLAVNRMAVCNTCRFYMSNAKNAHKQKAPKEPNRVNKINANFDGLQSIQFTGTIKINDTVKCSEFVVRRVIWSLENHLCNFRCRLTCVYYLFEFGIRLICIDVFGLCVYEHLHATQWSIQCVYVISYIQSRRHTLILSASIQNTKIPYVRIEGILNGKTVQHLIRRMEAMESKNPWMISNKLYFAFSVCFFLCSLVPFFSETFHWFSIFHLWHSEIPSTSDVHSKNERKIMTIYF